jgi:hypothetical protein
VPAVARLAESRERMRQWMLHADGRQEARRRAAAARAEGERPSWMDRLRGHAVFGPVIDAVTAWWANHPLRPAASVGNSLIRDAVAPLARRHPFSVVAGALVLGGVLAWLKPWRWIVKPALFAGLASQVITRLVTAMPLDAVLNAVAAFGEPHEAHAEDAGDAHMPPTDAPMPDLKTPEAERPTVH